MYILNADLKRRIIQLSYKHSLSHLSSCLTACDLIQEIYSIKKKKDIFVNSSAHNSVALYVVLEYYNHTDAEKLYLKHGVHCNRDIENDIWASGGSLGHGIGISVGAALSDRTRTVYCLVSDGELAEGSCWEALRIANELKLDNLIIYVNSNGHSAYKDLDSQELDFKLYSYCPNVHIRFRYTHNDQIPFLKGIQGHYLTLSSETYEQAIKTLEEDREI